ncbi:MAG: PD40 domain-containing protein [Acidobacteria bacterium]|nr:PD40 domain-containing protein [Acidobacteriota bacterium]
MKSLTAIWLIVAGTAVLSAQTTAQAEKLLQSARHKEVMQGDLKAAIEQYRKIAAQFAKQPEIAARALFQLGQCQEKLGEAEARKSYERIVREYGGAQYASAARQRLASLGGGEPSGQLTMRAVWTGDKVDSESSLSPDGRFISFPDWDTHNLALHDLVTGTDRLLTNTGSRKRGETVFAESSAMSRDGKQVAYTWHDQKNGSLYELRVVNVSGDPKPRRVYEHKSGGYLEPCDWSPDGKWIAASLWLGKNTSLPQQIVLIGAQDGALRVLTSSDTDRLLMGGFSSDGRYVVYTRRTGGGSRGYIISVDGKPEVQLIPGNSFVDSPVWTPDGSRIVFVSDRSGSPGLWSIRVVDGKPIGEPELLKADFTYARTQNMSTPAMGFTRDGSLVYRARVNQTDVYVAGLDPATGKLTSEPRRINERGVGNAGQPIAWLPDSKSLSFWSAGTVGALLVHTLGTREEREIWGGRSGRRPAGFAGWFPDGRSLMTMKREGQTRVYSRVDSTTLAGQASWTVPEHLGGAISPDLMTEYFSHKDETTPCEGTKCTFVISARSIETGSGREILRIRAAWLWGPSISPNGSEMAFIVGDDPNTPAVMVAPTAGGSPREIYRAAEAVKLHGRTNWTHDSRHVLAFRFMPSGGELWSFPTKGGPPEVSSMRVRPIQEPFVSPDGTQIAFLGGNTGTEIWVMTGLLPKSTLATPR